MIRKSIVSILIGSFFLAADAATCPGSEPLIISGTGAEPSAKLPARHLLRKSSPGRCGEKKMLLTQSHLSKSGFVPPPPPETPSLLSVPFAGGGGGGGYGQFVPIELLSPEALKKRQKELSVQLQRCAEELKNREEMVGEKRERSTQFVGLFNEGVISKRELDQSQSDLKSAESELENAKARIQDLQFAVERVNDKLKVLSRYHVGNERRAGSNRALAGSRAGSAKKAAGAELGISTIHGQIDEASGSVKPPQAQNKNVMK